ncbi:MAG: hypothetical protein ABF868_01955 [Sporolactobacillus sp.]
MLTIKRIPSLLFLIALVYLFKRRRTLLMLVAALFGGHWFLRRFLHLFNR